MASLITQEQFEDRLGRELTAAEEARFPGLSADASAKIRAYTGQTFDLVEDDEYVGRPVGTKVRLPQRPVLAVTSVTAVGYGGVGDIVLPEVGGWGWDGLDLVEIYPMAGRVWVNMPEAWDDADGPNTYLIVYDHGYAAAPDIVVAVGFDMLSRTLLSPSMTPGLTSERIGQYSYQMGQFPGGGTAGASVILTEADKAMLDAAGFRMRSKTVQLAN